MLKTVLKIVLACTLSLLMSACEDASDRLTFIGDSLIERWDTAAFFPTYETYNLGVSGAGISLIENKRGAFHNQTIVVMIGTNNSSLMRDKSQEEYVTRYCNAILGLDAAKVYLFSVLPRKYENDRENINTDISKFNEYVKAEMQVHPNIIYIDAYSDFLNKTDINQAYYVDGLHLNSSGYEILTSKLLHVLQ